MQIKNQKTLKPSEEVIKNLLDELIRLQLGLGKIKSAASQRQMVINVINVLKNPKRNFTFQNLWDVLLTLLKIGKTKETKAITAKIFLLFQKAYKDAKK